MMETIFSILWNLIGPLAWLAGLIISAVACARYRRWSWGFMTMASLCMVIGYAIGKVCLPQGCIRTEAPTGTVMWWIGFAAIVEGLCPLLLVLGLAFRWSEEKDLPNNRGQGTLRAPAA